MGIEMGDGDQGWRWDMGHGDDRNGDGEAGRDDRDRDDGDGDDREGKEKNLLQNLGLLLIITSQNSSVIK